MEEEKKEQPHREGGGGGASPVVAMMEVVEEDEDLGPGMWPSVLDPPASLQWSEEGDEEGDGGGVRVLLSDLQAYMDLLTPQLLMAKARYCRPPSGLLKKASKAYRSKASKPREKEMGNPALSVQPVERAGRPWWSLEQQHLMLMAQSSPRHSSSGRRRRSSRSSMDDEDDDEDEDEEEEEAEAASSAALLQEAAASQVRDDSDFSLLTRSIPWAEVAGQFRVVGTIGPLPSSASAADPASISKVGPPPPTHPPTQRLEGRSLPACLPA